MTRYYLDTEFIDTGAQIQLISIGIVNEHGSELYLQSCEFDHGEASEWVKNNVLAHLPMCPYTAQSRYGISGLYRADRMYHKKHGGQCLDQQRGYLHRCLWRNRAQMRRDVLAFFEPSEQIELYGWCAGYDFVVFCQIFGTMLDLPAQFPHYIRDLQHVLDYYGIADDQLPKQEGTAHHALEDARHVKAYWEFVDRNAKRHDTIQQQAEA